MLAGVVRDEQEQVKKWCRPLVKLTVNMETNSLISPPLKSSKSCNVRQAVLGDRFRKIKNTVSTLDIAWRPDSVPEEFIWGGALDYFGGAHSPFLFRVCTHEGKVSPFFSWHYKHIVLVRNFKRNLRILKVPFFYILLFLISST